MSLMPGKTFEPPAVGGHDGCMVLTARLPHARPATVVGSPQAWVSGPSRYPIVGSGLCNGYPLFGKPAVSSTVFLPAGSATWETSLSGARAAIRYWGWRNEPANAAWN